MLTWTVVVCLVIYDGSLIEGRYLNPNWVTQWVVLVQTLERNFPWCFCFNCLSPERSLDLGRILSLWTMLAVNKCLLSSTLWSPHIERRNGHKLISIRPQKSKDEKNIFDLYGVSIHQWCVCRMSICCWAFSHPSNELKLTTLVFSSLNDSQGGSEV